LVTSFKNCGSVSVVYLPFSNAYLFEALHPFKQTT